MSSQCFGNRRTAVGIEIWSLLVLGLALGCGAAESEPAVSSVTQALLPASINPFNEPYTIGAWYFTAWSQTNVHQAFWSQNPWVLGRWDPWGGVRDAYSNPDGVPNNTDHSFIPRKPAIGFYDLMDQRVMDKHIVQAASRGLSYFAFYWYWDADAQAESQESTPIHRFVSSPNKGLMKFMIAPMRDSMQAQPPPVTLTSFEERLVPYVVDTYFADSSYLATSDGRPVITDWDFGLADSDHAAGMQFLKEYTFAKLAKYPLILKMEAVSPDDDGAMCFQNNLGPYYLLRPGAPQSIDYGQMMQHFAWPAPSGITSDMVNLPCLTAGVDARPWCLLGPCPQGSPYYYYNTGFNTNTLASYMILTRYVFNSTPSGMKMLTLYAWNEWGEGGVIEPRMAQSGGADTAYLDAVKSAYSLTARTTDTTNANLEATFTVPENTVAVFVKDAYQTLLGRAPTTSEMNSYANIVLDKRQFIQDRAASAEYASKWSTQLATSTGAVNLLFQQLLGRAPTSAESSADAPIVAGYGRSTLIDSLLFTTAHFTKDPVLAPAYGSATASQGLTQVYRLKAGSDYFYTTDVVEMASARSMGYVVEGPTWKVFRTAGTNRAALYRCRIGSFHFISKESNCEGQTVEGPIGYGNPTAIPGSADLVRFASPTGAHIELLSTDTAGINAVLSNGFTREGVLMSLPSW